MLRNAPSIPVAEQAHVLRCIDSYGRHAMAFQTLEPGYRYFFDGTDCCIPYVDTGGAWIAAGNPLTPAADLAVGIERFANAAHAAGKRWCVFGADDELRNACTATTLNLPIGVQPEWNPAAWDATVAKHASLRSQIRRAGAKHVTVRLLTATELQAPAMQAALDELRASWLRGRAMATMGFLVQLELNSYPDRRRMFVAYRDNALVGAANVVPVPGRPGWFIEDLLRVPAAPNGTAELLVHTVMQWAAAQQCTWLTMGLAPLAGTVATPLRWARQVGNRWYNFDGIYQFKAKLHPAAAPPLYLLYPRGTRAPRYVLDVLTAFAPDGLWRFALQTARRMPTLRGR